MISFLNTSDKEFRIGDRVDLTVAFKGNPAAEVSWTFKPWNSNTSQDVPFHRSRIQNKSKYHTALVIETLNTNDFGTYKLQLKNIHGNISQDFKIQGIFLFSIFCLSCQWEICLFVCLLSVLNLFH